MLHYCLTDMVNKEMPSDWHAAGAILECIKVRQHLVDDLMSLLVKTRYAIPSDLTPPILLPPGHGLFAVHATVSLLSQPITTRNAGVLLQSFVYCS